VGSINNPKFEERREAFVKDLEEKGRAESTIIAYSKDIEQLLNFLSEEGITSLEEVKIEDLEKYKQDLQDNNYTPKSVSRKINSTRTFFKFLLEKSVIKDNPSEKLAHPRFKTKPPRVLTEMEYRALRDVSRVDVNQRMGRSTSCT